jgi:hypothetical protein
MMSSYKFFTVFVYVSSILFIAKLSYNLYKGKEFYCKKTYCWQIHQKIQNIYISFMTFSYEFLTAFVYVASVLFIAKLSYNLYKGVKLCCKNLNADILHKI